MKYYIKGNKGFTLIEIVLSLVLAGILASLAGLGLVQVSKAFIFVKDTSALAQKERLAMARMDKAITNLTDITAATQHSITLNRKYGQEPDIQETFSLDGSNLKIGNDILIDSVDSFDLYYWQGGNDPWVQGRDDISQLAVVEISLSHNIDFDPNIDTHSVVNKVCPRNTYVPQKKRFSPTGVATGPGSVCFIATAAYENPADPAVTVLRQFRDRFLLTWPGGRAFVKWYYRLGPDLAKMLKTNKGARAFTRYILSPLVGLAFLLLFYPLGLPLMILLSWFLAHVFLAVISRNKSASNLLFNQTGSVLIGLIVTMVIMAALAAGMLSLFSTSTFTGLRENFSPRAYYMAESGFRYAAYEYLDSSSDGTISNLHNKTFTMENGDTFRLFLNSYWFEATAGGGTSLLTVGSCSSFPESFTSGTVTQGFLQVGDSTDHVQYSGVSYDNKNTVDTTDDELTFTLTSTITPGSVDVYPECRVNGDQTINEGDNETLDLDKITNVEETRALPKMSGVVTINDGSEDYIIMYDNLNYTNDRLIGLHNVPGENGIPSGGLVLTDNDTVTLGKYAKIKSIGTAGSGNFSATRTVIFNQPLHLVKTYKKYYWGEDFDENDGSSPSNWTSVLGTHEISKNASDGTSDNAALKVTTTETTGYGSHFNPQEEEAQVEESVTGLDWQTALPEEMNLETIWLSSDKTLSYDIQVKTKFTETEDKWVNNFLGCYMPGLSFRLHIPTGHPEESTYYGLSYMRGIQGTSDEFVDPGGWLTPPSGYYIDLDDIPDTFFDDHNDNSEAAEANCGDLTPPTCWDDDPPKDGRPYIVLWQRTGEDPGQWDWLAYKKLCHEQSTTIYHYEEQVAPLPLLTEGYYDGEVSGDPRTPTPYSAIKLTDISNVLQTSIQEGVTILGNPGSAIIRDPGTDQPVAGAAYIVPDQHANAQAEFNYRIYLKPWVTIMARVMEMTGDFDDDPSDQEHVNVVQACFADTEEHEPGTGENYGYFKDTVRHAHPRGEIKWPEDGDYLTYVEWEELGYTSKTVDAEPGWGNNYKKLVDRGQDDDDDWLYAYTAFYTTEAEGDEFSDVEIGLHTLGIDASSSTSESDRETCYFDDFGLAIYETNVVGLLPGIQEE